MMEQINRIEELTRNDEESQVLERPASSEASDDQPDDGNGATAEFDPLPEIPDGDDVETRNWRRAIAGYVAGQMTPFTIADVWEHGLQMMPGAIERGDQMRIAAILRALGYDMQQRRVNGERQNLWSLRDAPFTEATAGPVVDAPSEDIEDGIERVSEGFDNPSECEDDAPLPRAGVDWAALQPPASIIGEAGATSTDSPGETARARCARLEALRVDLKTQLDDARRALHFVQEECNRASLEALRAGTGAAEGLYQLTVQRKTATSTRIEHLTTALVQLDKDLPQAKREADAEANAERCARIRDLARIVETNGPRMEALLEELGRTIKAYQTDIYTLYRGAQPVSSGDHWNSMPSTEYLVRALLGYFIQSSGFSIEHFTDLTPHSMGGMSHHESPSVAVKYQLSQITDRLIDNAWNALPDLPYEE